MRFLFVWDRSRGIGESPGGALPGEGGAGAARLRIADLERRSRGPIPAAPAPPSAAAVAAAGAHGRTLLRRSHRHCAHR